MTWTPKLLRKASFLRSSPIRATVGPREIKTSVVSRSSFQSNATQCTLPPTSSRFSLQPSSRSSLTPNSSRSAPHSNSSLSTLPPNDILQTLASSRPTSPPGRPAPPNLRTSLSPGPIALAVTPSTENAPNNVNTGSSQTTPVPAVRKVFFPASTSENTGMNCVCLHILQMLKRHAWILPYRPHILPKTFIHPPNNFPVHSDRSHHILCTILFFPKIRTLRMPEVGVLC